MVKSQSPPGFKRNNRRIQEKGRVDPTPGREGLVFNKTTLPFFLMNSEGTKDKHLPLSSFIYSTYMNPVSTDSLHPSESRHYLYYCMHTATLVHITPDAEDLISYMARVSNPSNQTNTKTSAKLIKYLIDHQHWSPFEMVNMCVSIDTTRSVAAQILRHRSFSFQEFSQRYAKVEKQAQVPELRRQDTKNRQNSIDDLDYLRQDYYALKIKHLYDECYRVYNEMLADGVAKECAREVLPMAAPTKLYMNGTIRSWLHYCDLRTSNGTQKEHAQIAAQIQDILYQFLPNVCEAMWNKNLD